MLLFFAYADFEETRVKYEKVHSIYQRFLDIEDSDPTLVRNQNQSGLLIILPSTILSHLIYYFPLKYISIHLLRKRLPICYKETVYPNLCNKLHTHSMQTPSEFSRQFFFAERNGTRHSAPL